MGEKHIDRRAERGQSTLFVQKEPIRAHAARRHSGTQAHLGTTRVSVRSRSRLRCARSDTLSSCAAHGCQARNGHARRQKSKPLASVDRCTKPSLETQSIDQSSARSDHGKQTQVRLTHLRHVLQHVVAPVLRRDSEERQTMSQGLAQSHEKMRVTMAAAVEANAPKQSALPGTVRRCRRRWAARPLSAHRLRRTQSLQPDEERAQKTQLQLREVWFVQTDGSYNDTRTKGSRSEAMGRGTSRHDQQSNPNNKCTKPERLDDEPVEAWPRLAA